MAIALDVANLGVNIEASGTSTTVAATTTSDVASGGFIVACIGSVENLTVTGVAGGSLSWGEDFDDKDASNFAGLAFYSAQCPAGLASGATITATFSGSAVSRFIGLSSFTGVATSSPVDGTPIGTLTMADDTPWSTGNYTIAAGSLLIGCAYDVANGPSSTATSGTELWEDIDAGGPNACVAQYRIEASAGAYALSGTWGTANDSRVAAIAYLAAAGATQALRPDADIVTTGWATAPLWSKIEEESADGTVITATAS